MMINQSNQYLRRELPTFPTIPTAKRRITVGIRAQKGIKKRGKTSIDANGRSVTAFHEAAHVFASVYVGRRFSKATIRLDWRTGSLGRVMVPDGGAQCRPLRLLSLRPKFPSCLEDADCFVLLSGPVAERIYTGAWNAVAGAGDIQRASAIAQDLHGPRAGDYLSQVESAAHSELCEHWNSVEIIAAHLLRYEHIFPAQAQEIVSKTVGFRLPVSDCRSRVGGDQNQVFQKQTVLQQQTTGRQTDEAHIHMHTLERKTY